MEIRMEINRDKEQINETYRKAWVVIHDDNVPEHSFDKGRACGAAGMIDWLSGLSVSVLPGDRYDTPVVAEPNRPTPGARYRHWKGKIYKVLMVVRHHSDRYDMVVYSEEADGSVWTRTTVDFFREVVVDGVRTKRFTAL